MYFIKYLYSKYHFSNQIRVLTVHSSNDDGLAVCKIVQPDLLGVIDRLYSSRVFPQTSSQYAIRLHSLIFNILFESQWSHQDPGPGASLHRLYDYERSDQQDRQKPKLSPY